MLRLARTATAVAIVAFAASLAAAQPAVPKNIIVIVGDGMGPAHFTACRLLRGANCTILGMPAAGLVATQPADRTVTDSAAAATAYATGSKTNYHMLSVDPTGKPLSTAFEIAKQNGKAIGVVTTSRFYDATPAAFLAHSKDRYDAAVVVPQMLRSGADLIAGSGADVFGKKGVAPLADLTTANGYAVVSTLDGIANAPAGQKLLALFTPRSRETEFAEAPLAALARTAIARLSTNPRGFALVVEHEGTDTASHYNKSGDVLKDIAAFDDAVGVALDYAATSGDTLVLVLGDHETGGLRIVETKQGAFSLKWSSHSHTGVAVPVFAYGPGSAAFERFQDNTEIGRTLIGFTSQSTAAAPARE